MPLFDAAIFDPAIFDTETSTIEKAAYAFEKQDYGLYVFEPDVVDGGYDNSNVVLRKILEQLQK